MRVPQSPDWARPRGYANGIEACGELVFVAGMIGWNAQQPFETDDFAAQLRQVLENVMAVFCEAGGGPEHIVRVTSKREYLEGLPGLGDVYRAVMGQNFPVMSVIAVSAQIEIVPESRSKSLP